MAHHPTTAAAKEARESDEDAVTSRAATPDQKKEVAKAIATKKHESSTPSTTQTAREDTPTMTARTDEKGELHTTATSTKTDGVADATLTPAPSATKQAGKDASREETATSADMPPMTVQKAENADGASTLHADEHHDSISTTDHGNEASQPNESRPCPSDAHKNAPDHEERIAELQHELAVLRAQVQIPAKSTFQIVERLHELRTHVRQTDAQADPKNAKTSTLSIAGDERTEKLIAIQLETEHLLHACAQAWGTLPEISPLTHEAGDAMHEDGVPSWTSISCEKLGHILGGPQNENWFQAKAWVITKMAWFAALTSSLEEADGFTVIPTRRTKTPTAGTRKVATDIPREDRYNLLDQRALDFRQCHDEIVRSEKERREQSWKLLRDKQYAANASHGKK